MFAVKAIPDPRYSKHYHKFGLSRQWKIRWSSTIIKAIGSVGGLKHGKISVIL